MQRRQFLQAGALASSSLWLGFSGQPVWAVNAELVNPWLRLERDNRLTVYVARAEMGQDVYTTLAFMVAEELDHPLELIRVEMATLNPSVYGNALLWGLQATGGSSSVRDAWGKLRLVGATARALLLQAAAQHFAVPVGQCVAEAGQVRCGVRHASYGELGALAAQQTLAQPATPKSPNQYRLLGRRLPRLDSRDKVLGKAQFGIDVRQPGMLSAGVSMCPVMGGKVASVDTTQALAMPGVHGVYTLPDGVAVVAGDFYQVSQAREKLKIRWDTTGLAPVPDNAAIDAILAQAADTQSGYVVRQDGQALPVSSQAGSVHRAYQHPILAHAALEPMNCSVAIEADACHVWGPFQSIQSVSMAAKAITGFPMDKIHVHTTFIGGGFGRKFELDCVNQALQIAKQSQRPIRLTWSREDDMQNDFYRPPALHRFVADMGSDGRIQMLSGKLVSPSVLLHANPQVAKQGFDPLMIEGMKEFVYDVPHLRFESVMQDVGVRVGYWRGVSHNLNAFAAESFMDELALGSGQDPLAFRLRHLEKQPRARAVLQAVAQQAGWGRATPAGRHLGLALWHCYGSYVAVVAEVSAQNGQPHVHKLSCVIDCGLALRPSQVEAQVEGGLLWGCSSALRNRITVKNGAVVEDNFDTYPVLRFADVPVVDVQVLSNGHPPGGVGEAGVPATAPAIANAWARASGKRLRSMPFLAE